MFKALVTDDNVFVLMKDSGNRLEVLKLEITPHDPCLQTICFLELPPLMPGVSVVVSQSIMEWVPTSKNYARTRSSRAGHAHFYSSAVGTIALYLDYHTSLEGDGDPYSYYALIIDVEALLYTIRTGVRSVPWSDWGPSTTHLFERTLLYPAGPSWIIGISSLVLRQYYSRRRRYTQPMPEDTSSSSRVFSYLWDECGIETKLPYRDVLMDDLNLGSHHVVADREWLVGIALASVREFCVCTLKPFRCEAAADRSHPPTGGQKFCPYHGVPFSLNTDIMSHNRDM